MRETPGVRAPTVGAQTSNDGFLYFWERWALGERARERGFTAAERKVHPTNGCYTFTRGSSVRN